MTAFGVVASDKKARVGTLKTARGEVETPVFLPVGTQATVKGLTPDDLKAIGVPMILANTYHLFLRPGADLVAKMGGLHKFMNWDRPILTDSGGFQVMSLGFGIEHEVGKFMPLFGEKATEEIGKIGEIAKRTKLAKVEEEGVTFQSHLDGSVHLFTPEISVETQLKLGADFIVALDECTSPLHNYEYTKASMERSHRWEKRSLDAAPKKNMFGVIQGGPFEDLRIESAKFVSQNNFFGIGIGGALVSPEQMRVILDWIYPHLDPQKPRHLLGIGTIPEIFAAVERGVDIFDCVAPTREARSGRIYSSAEHYNIANSKFATSREPLATSCKCYTCQNFTRGYVHHLFRANELLAYRLATIHNLYFMADLMWQIREAIKEKKFAKLKAKMVRY